MSLDQNHPFAATRKKARKPDKEGGGYASLSTLQKWEYHADVYGFRRVFLDVPRDERTSPCDQNGEWFDEGRVAVCERYWRRRMSRPEGKSQHLREAAE